MASGRGRAGQSRGEPERGGAQAASHCLQADTLQCPVPRARSHLQLAQAEEVAQRSEGGEAKAEALPGRESGTQHRQRVGLGERGHDREQRGKDEQARAAHGRARGLALLPRRLPLSLFVVASADPVASSATAGEREQRRQQLLGKAVVRVHDAAEGADGRDTYGRWRGGVCGGSHR